RLAGRGQRAGRAVAIAAAVVADDGAGVADDVVDADGGADADVLRHGDAAGGVDEQAVVVGLHDQALAGVGEAAVAIGFLDGGAADGDLGAVVDLGQGGVVNFDVRERQGQAVFARLVAGSIDRDRQDLVVGADLQTVGMDHGAVANLR